MVINIKLTSKHSPEDYFDVANKVLTVLKNNDCTSLQDFYIISSILRGYPVHYDAGSYLYQDQVYDSLKDLPIEAHKKILEIYDYH